jgi:hypothetical protein
VAKGNTRKNYATVFPGASGFQFIDKLARIAKASSAPPHAACVAYRHAHPSQSPHPEAKHTKYLFQRLGGSIFVAGSITSLVRSLFQ